ncbi:MAG: extensin family protein [Hyphomicrobiales bacterium]|nr:extensin family protein [Hyphomicrobiales bacterium]
MPPQRPDAIEALKPHAPAPSEDGRQLGYAPAPESQTRVAPPLAAGGKDFCSRLLASKNIVAHRVASIHHGACGINTPVSVTAIVEDDGHQIEMIPHPIMRCELASEVASWVIEDLAPRAQKVGGKIARIHNAASYDCRTMNHRAHAKLSEHGKGNAIDMRDIEFESGKTVDFVGHGKDRPFIAAIRETACERFNTVLGPGSDGYHEDHVHVDLYARKHDLHICRWRLR